MTGTPQTQSATQAGAGEEEQNAAARNAALTTDDLELVDELEDEGKTDQELWDEIEAAEAKKNGEDDDSAADQSAAAADESNDSAAAAGDEAAEGETSTDASTDDGATAGDENAQGEQQKPGDQSSKPAGGDTAKPNGQAKSDPWTNAPPELKAEFERLKAERDRLEQSDRSNRGRVSALQRQLADRVGVQPEKKKAPKALQSEKGKALREEYPEIAEPIAAELDELRTEVHSLREAREIEQRNARGDYVESKHPGYETTAASPEFADWLSRQPRYVQEAAARNGEWIVDADEAVDILDRFQAFRSAQSGNTTAQRGNGSGNAAGAQAGPSGQGSNAQGTQENHGSSSLSGRRRRQLESAAGTRKGGPGAASGIPEEGDPQAIWDAFEREDARKARRA